MNLCTACKFHSPRTNSDFGHEYTVHRCTLTGSINPVDGKRRGMSECHQQRRSSIFKSTCGKQGKHFEAKA